MGVTGSLNEIDDVSRPHPFYKSSLGYHACIAFSVHANGSRACNRPFLDGLHTAPEGSRPDWYCITLSDGSCISEDPRDMHRAKPAPHDEYDHLREDAVRTPTVNEQFDAAVDEAIKASPQTWTQAVPYLIDLLQGGDKASIAKARRELYKMAALADAHRDRLSAATARMERAVSED